MLTGTPNFESCEAQLKGITQNTVWEDNLSILKKGWSRFYNTAYEAYDKSLISPSPIKGFTRSPIVELSGLKNNR